MHCGGTTRKEDGAKETGFGCCTGDVQRVFSETDRCCAAPGGFHDCPAMMRRMMEAVKNQPCCGPAAEKTE
jgi:hypothetical protein